MKRDEKLISQEEINKDARCREIDGAGFAAPEQSADAGESAVDLSQENAEVASSENVGGDLQENTENSPQEGSVDCAPQDAAAGADNAAQDGAEGNKKRRERRKKPVPEWKQKSVKDRLKLALSLFLNYFKIGLFTFGGGYAMISIIQKEFVHKKKWIEEDELLEIIAIAESTPGPIAINCATYVGYKILGFWGSVAATLGVVLPSFTIIYVISLFLDAFLKIDLVAKAFKGIQVAVGLLILTAGISMFSQMKKDVFAVCVVSVTFVVMVLIDLFAWNFSSIYILLIGGALGLFLVAFKGAAQRRRK